MTSRNAPPSSQGPSSAPAQDAEHSDDLQPQLRDRQTRRERHSHTHAHSHARLHHQHNRLYHSPDLHDRQVDATLPDETPQDPPANEAQADNPVPYYTHVIQTISLIYGTDAEGLPSIKTLPGPLATVVVDSQTGETVAAISAQDIVSTPPAPAPEPAASEAPPSSIVPPTTLSAPLTTAITPEAPDDTELSSLASPAADSSELTTAPLPPASTAVVVPPGHNNATNTPLSADPSTHSATNTTLMRAFDFSTTPLPVTTTSSRSTVFSHTTLSSFISSSTTDSPSSTGVIGGGGGGAPSGEEDQVQPTAPAETDNGEPLSPQEKQIVGGVVGGVAGAAFFILLIMLALRYKKRKQAHLALEDNDGGMRSLGAGGAGDSGGPAMSQRSSMPAAVATAMASLTGKRRPPPEPVAGGERGFYRVSGRKLTSVLQTGGDGYSDPHASVASGNSDYYRGSQAFEPGAGSNHLALGSPMRPVSGVMVMRDGPGRTPVTEQNPFADPPSPPPTQGPGTLGRSLAGHDGSGASRSRFREVI